MMTMPSSRSEETARPRAKWAWGDSFSKRETWTRGTFRGLDSGEKATLKPENTPWSRPRFRPLEGMLWPVRRDWIFAARDGEPTEGKVAV